MAKRLICTLTPDQATDQLGEWRDVHQRATRVESVMNGVRLSLPSELDAQVRDLADREARCCSFLDLAVASVDDHLELTITSSDPGAEPIIALIAGTDA